MCCLTNRYSCPPPDVPHKQEPSQTGAKPCSKRARPQSSPDAHSTDCEPAHVCLCSQRNRGTSHPRSTKPQPEAREFLCSHPSDASPDTRQPNSTRTGYIDQSCEPTRLPDYLTYRKRYRPHPCSMRSYSIPSPILLQERTYRMQHDTQGPTPEVDPEHETLQPQHSPPSWSASLQRTAMLNHPDPVLTYTLQVSLPDWPKQLQRAHSHLCALNALSSPTVTLPHLPVGLQHPAQ